MILESRENMPVVMRRPVGQGSPRMLLMFYFIISNHMFTCLAIWNNILKYTIEIYTEYSKIATRISFKCQIHITTLNNKYNT